ncbi:MAG: sensor histidine kinase [Clostridium sp.]|nr:sensor histidine kinase [Clostridium sp.]
MKTNVNLSLGHWPEWPVHICTWLFLFGLPAMIMGWTHEEIREGEMLRMVGPPLSIAFVFYINYLRLVPRLLLSRRPKSYMAVNLLIWLVMLVFTHFWFEICRIYFPHTSFHHPVNNPGMWELFLFRLRDFFLYGLTTALSVVVRMSQQWHKAEAGRQKAELRRMEAELKNLHNQINPHFLLNTLNNIYALIAFDPERAQQAVQDLSRLLRHVLYDNNQPFIPLARELEFLQNYVALMKIRLSEQVDLQFDIRLPEDHHLQIAPMLFISLIENAFKHGISPIHPSFIHILIHSRNADTLTCRIENSNFPKKRNDISGSGIGLEQVQKRLELIYHGRYEWNKGLNEDQTVYFSELTLKNI